MRITEDNAVGTWQSQSLVPKQYHSQILKLAHDVSWWGHLGMERPRIECCQGFSGLEYTKKSRIIMHPVLNASCSPCIPCIKPQWYLFHWLAYPLSRWEWTWWDHLKRVKVHSGPCWLSPATPKLWPFAWLRHKLWPLSYCRYFSMWEFPDRFWLTRVWSSCFGYCKKLGLAERFVKISVYYPQMDGLDERFNGILKGELIIFLGRASELEPVFTILIVCQLKGFTVHHRTFCPLNYCIGSSSVC